MAGIDVIDHCSLLHRGANLGPEFIKAAYVRHVSHDIDPIQKAFREFFLVFALLSIGKISLDVFQF